MKRIYIVDADRSFVQNLENILFNAPDYKVLGHSFKANDFLMKISEKKDLLNNIDLLLINPKLNDLNGLDLIKKIQKYRADINIAILLNENIKTFFINDIAEVGIENVLIYPNDDNYFIEGINKAFDVKAPIVGGSMSQHSTTLDSKSVLKELSSESFLDSFDFDKLNSDFFGKEKEPVAENKVEEVVNLVNDNYFDYSHEHDILSYNQPVERVENSNSFTNEDVLMPKNPFGGFEETVAEPVSQVKPKHNIFEDDSTKEDYGFEPGFDDNCFGGGFGQNATDFENPQPVKPSFDNINNALDLSSYGIDTSSFNNNENQTSGANMYDNYVGNHSMNSQPANQNNQTKSGFDAIPEKQEPISTDYDSFFNFMSGIDDKSAEAPKDSAPKQEPMNNFANESMKHKGFVDTGMNNVPQSNNFNNYGLTENRTNSFDNTNSGFGDAFSNPNNNSNGFDSGFDNKQDDYSMNLRFGSGFNGNQNQQQASYYEPYPPTQQQNQNTFNQSNYNAIESMYNNTGINDLNYETTSMSNSNTREEIESVVNAPRNTTNYNNIPNFAKQIVAFYSTKGGIGKTTLAINSVIQLTKYSQKRICVIDFDLTNANVHTHLGIMDSKYDLSVISNFDSEIDTFTMQRLVTPYHVTDKNGVSVNFDVIVGFKEMRMAQRFNEKEVHKILSILEEMYDIVIVDMHPVYTDLAVSTILKKATKIIFVAEQEMTSLNGAKDFIVACKRYGIPPEKLFLVLNRYKESPYGFNKRKIETSLGKEIYATIPSNIDSLREAINTNTPITLSNPDSGLARSYIDVARIIDKNLVIPTSDKGGFFSRRKK